ELALREPPVRVVEVALVQLGVELNRGLELLVGLLVAAAQREREAARRVRLRQVGGQLERLAAGRLRLLQVGGARVPVLVELRAAIGDAGIGPRVARVDLDRPAEHAPGELESLLPE